MCIRDRPTVRLCPKSFGGRGVVRVGQSHGVVQGVEQTPGAGAIGRGPSVRSNQAEQRPLSFGGATFTTPDHRHGGGDVSGIESARQIRGRYFPGGPHRV
eukprot:10237296-Prorocentrum_lima.AAC.1